MKLNLSFHIKYNNSMTRKTLLFILVVIASSAYFHKAYSSEPSPPPTTPLSCNPNGVLEKFDDGGSGNSCTATRINRNDLLVGNPFKDGIPSIDSPQFVSADETIFKDGQLIIGLEINGDARAYPYAILNWHEIVNDVVGGIPVAVTYCPLCETNSVFIRKVSGLETTFGVSGGLYHSCLVMYDRFSESLWVQPWGTPVSGRYLNGNQLERVPATRTTLGEWKKKYPQTRVLSTDTGHIRDYHNYPYGSFYTNEKIYFPVRNQEKRQVHPKEISFVVFSDEKEKPFDKYGGESFVVTLKELKEKRTIKTQLNNKEVLVSYDKELNSVKAVSGENTLPVMAAFGFVPPAFFE